MGSAQNLKLFFYFYFSTFIEKRCLNDFLRRGSVLERKLRNSIDKLIDNRLNNYLGNTIDNWIITCLDEYNDEYNFLSNILIH